MDVHSVRTLRDLLGRLSSPTSLLVVLGVSLVFSWFPEGIKGLMGIALEFTNMDIKEGIVAPVQLISSLLILFVFYLWIRKFTNVRTRYRVEPVDRHFKVLVVFLSKPKDNNYLKAHESVESLDELRENYKGHNWEPVLKGLNLHKATVERLIVIPSKDTQQFEEDFRAFVRKLFDKDIEIEFESWVDFESIDKVQQKVESVYERLKKEGFKNEDIVIDITGGTKHVSIGGASSTVIYHDRYFQYSVPEKPVVYNMVALDS